MIIISCDKAKILFVTDTISDVLNESVVSFEFRFLRGFKKVLLYKENWLGTTLYDLLHPKDIQKVKEQLTSFDVEEGKSATSHSLHYFDLIALAANSKQNVGKCKPFFE